MRSGQYLDGDQREDNTSTKKTPAAPLPQWRCRASAAAKQKKAEIHCAKHH
jgi:hypothetical protein